MKRKIISLFLIALMIISIIPAGIGGITTLAAGVSASSTSLKIEEGSTDESLREFVDSLTNDKLSSIKKIYLLTNALSDDSFIYLNNKLPNLNAITCTESEFKDISFVANLSSIATVSFNSCQVEDISPIVNCHNLTTAIFKDNYITDISPIAQCPNLTEVHFQNNYITDISPIFVTGKITTASFGNNNITDVDITDPNIEPYFRNNYQKISYIDISDNPLSTEFFTYIQNIRTYSKLRYTGGLYDGIVKLNDSDFRSLIFDSLTVDNETKTITITSRKDASYVAFNNISPNRLYNYTVAEDNCVDKYTSQRYKISKPADSNTYTTKLVADGIDSLKLAKACYTLVVNFVEDKPTFEADKLTIKNATNKSFDAENSALTIDSDVSYVRIYKALTNGSTVSVDAEKYGFITEYDNFYQINKNALAITDLNIASFDVTTDSGDTITTTVNFPSAGELPFTKLFKITNYDSITQEENTINLDIVDTKTFSVIYKAVADGSTLTIDSDSTFVEERADCYVLRQRAVGETITMTYGDTTYTINLTK